MLVIGTMINERYQILRLIGEGGMANVYLANDTVLNRKVAIKILRGELASNEDFLKRFQREALSASSLHHKNIVDIYDVGEDNGHYYIVMEYIEGKTLKKLIKERGALTITEVVDIMQQLTDGLSKAHSSLIVHRDIKPENIIIQKDGTVKITDFGLAVAINASKLTRTDSVMGSVYYMAPERASGDKIDIKSDIYSLGILMFELLTGRLPFDGDSPINVIMKHINEPIPSVREINPAIPQSVENVILKACAKNEENRYNSTKEMFEDLKTVLDEQRENENRYEYAYFDTNRKTKDLIQELEKIQKEKEVSKEEQTKTEETKTLESRGPVLRNQDKKTIIILGSIFTGLCALVLLIFFIVPIIFKVSEVVVPDVSGMSVVEAERKLINAGLDVELEVISEYSETIEKGLVTRTSPRAGRTVKKNTKVIIYESKGKLTIEIEDYVGQDYDVVKVRLEEIYGLNVFIEKEEVEDKSINPDLIIRQSVKPGTLLKPGDEITLYIPDVILKYPDMMAEGWTEEAVKAFAEDYGLKLSIEYVETLEHEPDTVISQDRPPGTNIVKGASLRVQIALAPEEEIPEFPEEEIPEFPEEGEEISEDESE